MPEPEPAMDFTGLTTAAAAAFKPDYADVQARARKRRRRWSFGAAFLAVGLVLGGGSAVALTADRSPAPVIPRPDALPDVLPDLPPDVPPGPWRTTEPEPGARAPQPAPSFHEIKPGLWDPIEADEPLTGIFTELRAGDLNHLYLEYRDCVGKDCRAMVAVTTDRGRTWRKLPLPEPKAGLTLVHGTLVLALGGGAGAETVFDPENLPEPSFWVSTDAAGTWRRAAIRDVDALPAGWPVFEQQGAIAAVDPATGDLVRVRPGEPEIGTDRPVLLETPARAGLWAMGLDRGEPAIKVSADGGRTWDTRPLPDALQPRGDDGYSMDRSVYTSDGRTVYARERLRDGLRIHVSTDGARTWRAGATVDLDGPTMSVLPIGSRTVLVEGLHGTHRSDDHGMTFKKVGPALGYRGHAMPGGYTIPTHNNEYSAWVSPDGATWTYVPRPEVP